MAAHLTPGLLQLAHRQGGCFHIDQAERAGCPRRSLRTLAERGLLTRPHSTVFCLPGATGWERDLWAATLRWPTGVVSHESAGRLHGMSALPGGVTSLIVPTGSHTARTDGVRLHQTGPVVDRDLAVVRGWRVTTPARTVVDLAGTLSPARLGHLLDDALASRLVSLGSVGVILTERSASGRRGGPALARQLDLRSGEPVRGNRLERLLDDVLYRAGLTGFADQYPLPTDGSLVGFVDRAHLDGKLIVEADGRRWHSRVADLARDRARDRRAAAEGWQTLRVLYEELLADPGGIARDVAATLVRRLGVEDPRRSAGF